MGQRLRARVPDRSSVALAATVMALLTVRPPVDSMISWPLVTASDPAEAAESIVTASVFTSTSCHVSGTETSPIHRGWLQLPGPASSQTSLVGRARLVTSK